MAPEKVTLMRLKVDLQCSKCTKKVKKVLCKIPQVRAQVFDDKANIVNITVVCCDPEKIRDKICCKGGGAIKAIEIVEPPKKPAADDKKKDAGDGDKKKDGDKKDGGAGDKPKDKPAGGDKPKDKPAGGDKPKDKPAGGDKPKDKPAGGDKQVVIPAPPPVAVAAPAGMEVAAFYEGYPCGPSYYGYGQPMVVYDGYYGRPVYDSYGGGGRPVYVSRCDQYFNEENPQGCSIM